MSTGLVSFSSVSGSFGLWGSLCTHPPPGRAPMCMLGTPVSVCSCVCAAGRGRVVCSSWNLLCPGLDAGPSIPLLPGFSLCLCMRICQSPCSCQGPFPLLCLRDGAAGNLCDCAPCVGRTGLQQEEPPSQGKPIGASGPNLPHLWSPGALGALLGKAGVQRPQSCHLREEWGGRGAGVMKVPEVAPPTLAPPLLLCHCLS